MSTELDNRIAALEGRIQELEDDRAIRQVLARYGYFSDLGLHDSWVELFADDGSMEYSINRAIVEGQAALETGPGTSRPEDEVFRRYVGHDELKKVISSPDSHMLIQGRSLHIMGVNLTTRIDGATAVAECYNVLLVRSGAKYDVASGSISRWTLTKRDGRWLIKDSRRRAPASLGFDQVLNEFG